jgi:cytochrome c553
MKKSLPILLFFLVGCGPSMQEKEEIAIITCNIMGESREMDSGMRIKEINAAREKMGENAFLGKDDVIQESFDYGLCKELVLNEPLYKETIAEIDRQVVTSAAVWEQEEKELIMINRDIALELTLKQNSLSKLMEIGAIVYERNCVACHQLNGQGISGIFPALAGSDIVLNDKARHLEILMEGVQGAAMLSYANQLSEGEMASVITFVSNSWGNDSYVTQPHDIQKYNEKNGE